MAGGRVTGEEREEGNYDEREGGRKVMTEGRKETYDGGKEGRL